MKHSRRELLSMLGYGRFWAWERTSLWQDATDPRPRCRDPRLLGTGTLEIGEANWKKAEEDARVKIDFTDNGNDLVLSSPQ